MTYPLHQHLFKSEPWPHQAKVLEKTWGRTFLGVWWEPRTGKTKLTYDTAAHLHYDKRIATMVIWAPNGVHRNWIEDEAPKHLAIPYRGHVWRSAEAHLRKTAASFHTLNDYRGLSILALNCEASTHKMATAWIAALLKRGPMLMVVDESADFANMGAHRTRGLLKWRDVVDYRRCLDGTPNAENPLELFSQCEFLKHGLLGASTETAFKYRYAKIVRQPIPGTSWEPHKACAGTGCLSCAPYGLKECVNCRGFGCDICAQYDKYDGDVLKSRGRVPKGIVPARIHDKIEAWINQDELKTKLATFSTTLKRADLGMLPPRFSRRYFALSDEQARVYQDLKRQYLAELGDGRRVTAPMVLTRYLRLQQVASNFWPETEEVEDHAECAGAGCEACGYIGMLLTKRPLSLIDGACNSRLEALLAELRRLPGQCTIWCRFHQDADFICEALRGDAVRYDGTVPESQRAINKIVYQKRSVRYLVGNPAAGGRGLDFSQAEDMIFYNNSFRARHRLQAKDRGESMLRSVPTAGLDLVAEGTVDEFILKCLEGKQDLMDKILAGAWQEGLA